MATERTVTRSKSRFTSARAAWTDIARSTGLSPQTTRLKRMDSATEFRWVVLGPKPRGPRGSPFRRRRSP